MLYIALISILSLASPSLATSPFSHTLFDRVLQTHVDLQGSVDYAALQADRAPLDNYIDSLALYSPQSHPQRFLSPNHQLAYWINTYNAFVLRGILDAYPVDSVMDIKYFNGFFNRQKFIAGGQEMTLDHLENQIIRPIYKDPRIHFAVNCGALSCPMLENRTFNGADLDLRLAAAQERFMTDPQHIRIDRQAPAIHLSKILDWYGDDFVNWYPNKKDSPSIKTNLLDYLILYLPPKEADFLRQNPDLEISFYEYNWQLNGQSGDK